MFKIMGVKNVFILNGGLPAWLKQNYPTIPKYQVPKQGNVVGQIQSELFQNAQQVLNAINNTDNTIIDARSCARFLGDSPEPRAGVRSGHIPSSINLPFAQLLTNGAFKDKNTLQRMFEKSDINLSHKLIFSCGSGITACIILVAAFEAGYQHLSLYDGSWSEWGSDETLPLETH